MDLVDKVVDNYIAAAVARNYQSGGNFVHMAGYMSYHNHNMWLEVLDCNYYIFDFGDNYLQEVFDSNYCKME